MIAQRLVLALLTPLVVYAQEADTSGQLANAYRRLFFPELKLLAQSSGDSVVLRWAPSNAPAWRAYNRIGYHVERALLDTTSPTPLRYERLTQEPLKPWTLEEWKRRSRPDHQFAAIAAQCLYGRVSSPQPNTAESILDAATELENRFGFALFAADCDAHAATGLGLRFVDRAVRTGQTWIYRIFPARQDSVFALDTAVLVVDVEPYRPWPPVLSLEAEETEREITIRWKNLYGGGYTAFNVYRTGPDGQRRKLNSTPIVPATPRGWTQRIEPWFRDTTAEWNVRYTYEVRGISPFAEEGAPATIVALLRDRTPPPPPVLGKPTIYGMTMVRLEWSITAPPDLSGFVVMKSDKPDRDWRALHEQPLPPTQRTLLDTLADPDLAYYAVIALDTAGNRSEYLPIYVDIHDTIPPAPPTNVRGTIDTNGVVRLEWNLGTERDLLGYRVLWANDTTHEFTQRTNLVWMDTVFTDTVALNTLTEFVYYRVVAVDTRHFHSDPSPIVAIKRPDIVPPVAPLFTDVYVTEDRVQLRWQPSTSSDVARQVLYRRVGGDTAWRQIAELAPEQQTYVDTAVVQRTTYSYTLEAIDRSGLRSERALPVHARPFDPGVREPVQNLHADYDTSARAVVVEWALPRQPAEQFWFVVYRAVDDGELTQYRAVAPGERRFVDRELVGRGRYRYAVRVMTALGSSPLSPVAVVVVR
jgi:hypothetical protein